jgi:hypothetical protein
MNTQIIENHQLRVCVSAFSDLNCLFVSLSALSLPALSQPGLLAYLVCSLIFANSACLHLIITLAFDFTRNQLLNLRDHHLRVLRLDFFRLKLSASQPSAGLLDHIKVSADIVCLMSIHCKLACDLTRDG